MLHQVKLTVEWFHNGVWGEFSEVRGVRGVSAKHCLQKGLKVATGWPCFVDREDAGIDVMAEAILLLDERNNP